MAKCKYPNEVCANMTVLNEVAYCDSVPCSLKDELPKQTNADRIRSMTDEELADFLDNLCLVKADFHCEECNNPLNCDVCYLDWLQSEAE